MGKFINNKFKLICITDLIIKYQLDNLVLNIFGKNVKIKKKYYLSFSNKKINDRFSVSALFSLYFIP